MLHMSKSRGEGASSFFFIAATEEVLSLYQNNCTIPTLSLSRGLQHSMQRMQRVHGICYTRKHTNKKQCQPLNKRKSLV